MLNLFCYTALFSVHALKNGIEHSVNIDLSKSVIKRAKNNYRLNDLNVSKTDFIYGDALYWVKRLKKTGRTFQFTVLDPPTFSRHRKRTFSVKKNYKDILSTVNDITGNGFAFTSVNSFKISKEEYLLYHPKSWELITFKSESSDFISNGDTYLKAGLWRCL